MNNTNWDNVIDFLQAGLVWFVIIVVVICTCALVLFDVLVGAGAMYFLTQQNAWVSITISTATTGLLMALMFISYNLSQNTSQSVKNIGYVVVILAFLVYVLDVYFDSLTADILRFGQIVSTEEVVHNLFRALLAGISTIGEAMAVSIIVGMPVLKTIINNAIPAQYRSLRSTTAAPTHIQRNNYTVPTSIPRASKPTPQPAPVERTSTVPEPTYVKYHPVHPKSTWVPENYPDVED